MLYTVLLFLHITAGTLVLISATISIVTKGADMAHAWHRSAGTIFTLGMTVIFLTALPMSLIKPNLFLLLLSIFSFYLAAAGWRLARNRRGTPSALDWALHGLMALTAVGMIAFGGLLLARGQLDGVSLIVFGAIGGQLSLAALRALRAGGVRGKQRVANHLTFMLAGTISALTAVLVVNFTFNPPFVLWLAPTALLTPLIVWWNRRLQAGATRKGMA